MPQSLSILLLCWNHRAYIGQCIEALAGQSDRDFEIVLLDNGSSDGSIEEARALFDRHGLKARIIVNEAPRSIPANLNKLLANSAGSVVGFLSTDDYHAPNYVARMRAAAAAHPEAGWFSCGGWHLQQETGELTEIPASRLQSRAEIRDALLSGRAPFFFVGLCYRRNALESVGGWDEDIPIEDADLFFRLSGTFPHVAVDEPLVTYRKHAGGASSDPAYMIDALEKFYAKHRGAFSSAQLRQRRSDMLRSYAALHADRGESAAAIRAAFRALVLQPGKLINWRTMAYALRSVPRG